MSTKETRKAPKPDQDAARNKPALTNPQKPGEPSTSAPGQSVEAGGVD